MAQHAVTSALLGPLITTVTGFRATDNAQLLEKLQESALRTLKSHQYGRTNQFEVEVKVDGLIERFEILNRDDLAIALERRRQELHRSRNKWIPEFLALLLELSGNPLENTNGGVSEAIVASATPQQLTWEEILREDPWSDEEVWAEDSFSAASSDDEFGTARGVVTTEAVPKEDALEDDQHLSIQSLIVQPDPDMLRSIEDAQFWRHGESGGVQGKHSSNRQLAELSLLREVLLMLRGLPTSTFSSFGTAVTYDKAYTLAEVQSAGLTDILTDFADLGSRLNRLRAWLKRRSAGPLLESFRAATSACLSEFDKQLSYIEMRYACSNYAVTVSLLSVEDEISRASNTVMRLAEMAAKLSGEFRPFACLELLFHEVCLAQATGETTVYGRLADAFLSCLQIYLNPIKQWMEKGELDVSDSSSLVYQTGYAADLSTLWEQHFQLRFDEDGSLLSPTFLQAAGATILTAGKSIVFLKYLGKEVPHDSTSEEQLTFHSVCGQDAAVQIAPFAEQFAQALDVWIRSRHSCASSVLLRYLFEDFQLSQELDALEYVFLSRDGCLFQEFADQVFQRVDGGSRNWNDRFLLSELAQRIFGAAKCVDVARVSVRSFSGNTRGAQSSMKALERLDINYSLSWPILNVVQRESLRTYQNMFTMLLQVYRAKYLLRQENASLRLWALDAMTLATRQRLIWFTDIFYTYVVDIVLAPGVETMRQQMSKGQDMDTLIQVHRTFAACLESRCLLAKTLAPVRDAVISILDLAILYTTARAQRLDSGRSGRRRGSSVVRNRGAKTNNRRVRRDDSYEETTDEEDSADDLYDADTDTLPDKDRNGIDGGGGRRPDEEPHGDPAYARASYDERIKIIGSQFGQLCNFAIAGLRSTGRASGEACLEELAERLEWGMLGRA